MNIICDGKTIELKYTFNSTRNMKGFKLSDIERIGDEIFSMIDITEKLLRGAMNKEPSEKYSDEQVLRVIEDSYNDGTLPKLFKDLLELLKESPFFEGYQKLEADLAKELVG